MNHYILFITLCLFACFYNISSAYNSIEIEQFLEYIESKKNDIGSYQKKSDVISIKDKIRYNNKEIKNLRKLNNDLNNIKDLIGNDGKLKDNYLAILKNKYDLDHISNETYSNNVINKNNHYFGFNIRIFRDNILGNNDVEGKIKTIPGISYRFMKDYLYFSSFISMVKFYNEDNSASYEVSQDYLYGLSFGFKAFRNNHLIIIPNIAVNYINYTINNNGLINSGSKNFKTLGLENLIKINSKFFLRIAIDYTIDHDGLFHNEKHSSCCSSRFLSSLGFVVKFN